ncbi:Heme-binding protein 2-like 5 [Homarus americanus]|uniref:Heme-binding protein 2-like 5 n=1 Tax=Homarus americanus TaxID=6706 RepID=A0A8J5N725_HOMAM|nr:Heme-binding protein 2-like 5 [Homarus americanus]
MCVVTWGIETAPYQVVDTTQTYEERVYPEQKWVTTWCLSVSHHDATNDMFHKLFNYIAGQNDEGIKIDMTAPVTTLVQPGEGPNCENNFTMSFYVPAVHQDNPPTPTNPDVRFHGFTKDEDWITNAALLAEDLQAADQEDVDFHTYYTAGYDSPFVIFNRTNEVWFMKH